MKAILQNILLNRTINRVINITFLTFFNSIFIIIIFYIVNFLFPFTIENNYFLFLIMLILFSSLPILNFFLDKFDSVISPAGYNDIYSKTINSILNIESFDEILWKIFPPVIKLLKAEFGHIIYYRDEKKIIDIEYFNNETYMIYQREKSESDNILLRYIKGPDDIGIKTKNKKPADKEIIKALELMQVDLVVPVFYNNKISGIIAIGGKKGLSESEIKLLKIIAFKLALLSSNSYYFSEIKKRREVEKEYELTNKIQKQFLPEPSLKSGRVIIEAHHNTTSSFTREFFDIFVNDALPDDIRLSAYHVFGDVKETSIFMPGVQAILQSYARLGFSPRKTITKLIKFVKERDVFNGDLIIFHSSIKQSGEFNCYCSNYPAPFYYQKSSKRLIHSIGKGSRFKYFKIKIKPGDILIAVCNYYFEIINSNIPEYLKILNKYNHLSLEKIKDILLKTINDSHEINNKNNKIEGEDQLLILIGMEDIN
jgi:hypothetical protein